MDHNIYVSIVMGVVGGLVRSLVGMLKYFEKNKEGGRVRPWYLVFSLFVSAVVGALAGALADSDWRLAAVAGYAGTDFIEGLYKIKKAQGLEN
ncbi:MAG: hypothetical protein B6D63_04760 [Candidatus Latescibacteria bacterium 4484_7]|nr:MAG: hypothetical protein B6D63_04760 [Candidatus Latescibacteria bacterium 4484_7]